MQHRRDFLRNLGAGVVAASGLGATPSSAATAKRPNILFCITDDQSWCYTSRGRSRSVVKTPHFDRIAREGIYFTNAYCASPSCSPSRAAILTGQDMWRLEDGGVLFGALPKKFQVFPPLLAEAGYHVGYTGKGYGPANLEKPGYWRNPMVKGYFEQEGPAPRGMAELDYAANFAEFLRDRPGSDPFFFWAGFYEPHRKFPKGLGAESGMNLDDIEVPPFLPDSPEVRSDLADYFTMIQWTDTHLGRMIDQLEKAGELDNTLIVFTSDNGLPFPRAKTTLYDHGTRMPLAVRWGDRIQGERSVTDFVNLTDMAPTFLEAAGLPIPPDMTGRSMLDLLLSNGEGRVDSARDYVVTGVERHTLCRAGNLPYPSRALRTDPWLYIRNFEPERWPAGDPPPFKPMFYKIYDDIDGGPTIDYMMAHKDDPEVAKRLALAVDRRPAQELYDLKRDPDQINNVAADPGYARIASNLDERLMKHLRDSGDPRARGEAPWDRYPFYFDGEDLIRERTPR
jgi:uncharacterized sulfatase